MKILQDKICEEGRVLSDTVLKVDTFLNHQVDPALMLSIGQAFAALYEGEGVTKVLTLESSGIAPAIMTALTLKVPLVFARKQKSLILQDDLYVEQVYSFTKQVKSDVTVARKLLSSSDRVLIIDDFLAHGEAAFGMARIVKAAGANVVGIGIVIEKSFQGGANKLREAGYRVDSLAKIAALTPDGVVFSEEQKPAYLSKI